MAVAKNDDIKKDNTVIQMNKMPLTIDFGIGIILKNDISVQVPRFR